MTRTIRFDMCVSPNIVPPTAFETERVDMGNTLRNALSRAGVPAELTSAAGSPVDFTVKLRGRDTDHAWSGVLSLFTLSVVPGYYVERTTLEVDLAWLDAAHVQRTEHLQYEARMSVFIWLPLIVYPDIFAGINGGFESAKAKDAGLEQLFERLGDDIRTRLGRGRETPLTSEAGGVVCPKQLGPAPSH